MIGHVVSLPERYRRRNVLLVAYPATARRGARPNPAFALGTSAGRMGDASPKIGVNRYRRGGVADPLPGFYRVTRFNDVQAFGDAFRSGNALSSRSKVPTRRSPGEWSTSPQGWCTPTAARWSAWATIGTSWRHGRDPVTCRKGNPQPVRLGRGASGPPGKCRCCPLGQGHDLSSIDPCRGY